MRFRLSLIAVSLSLLLPGSALAMQQTMLDFSNGEELNQWRVVGDVTSEAVAGGIHLRAGRQGALLRPLDLKQNVDVLEIRYVSPMGTDLSIVWQGARDDENTYRQIPVKFQPSMKPETFTIALAGVSGWDPHPTTIGFSFPAGSDMILGTVALKGWGAPEKLFENIKCFWTFDGIRSYSINFLWGPLLCSSPVAREVLFQNVPPRAHSGMRVIYALLIAGSLALIARRWLKDREALGMHALKDVLVLFLCLWVFLDLRMGSELLFDWKTDVQSFLLEPPGKRVFRALEFFPDFSTSVLPVIKGQPTYVLLTPTPVQFNGYIRYQTYPSIPVTPAEGSGATVWLAYDRPDLSLSSDGRIVERGEAISPPGAITHEFAKGTFIFRVKK